MSNNQEIQDAEVIHPLEMVAKTCEFVAKDIDQVRTALYKDPDFLEPLVSAIENEVRSLVADPLTDDGRKQIEDQAAWARRAARKLDEFRKNLVDELKKQPAKIDANVRPFRIRLENLASEVLQPVTEIRGRIDRLELLRNKPALYTAANSQQIKEVLEELRAMDKSEQTWKEAFAEFTKTHAKAMAELSVMLTDRMEKERQEEEFQAFQKAKAEKEMRERIERETRERIEREQKAKAEQEAKPTTQPEPQPRQMSKTIERQAFDELVIPHQNAQQEAYEDLKAAIQRAPYKDPVAGLLTDIINGKVRHIHFNG